MNSSSNYSTDVKRQKKTIPTKCAICGGPALYSYFGVIACEACKVFFRKNAKQGLVSCKCTLSFISNSYFRKHWYVFSMVTVKSLSKIVVLVLIVD